jgi:transposase
MGNVNSQIFLKWVTQKLLPQLPQKSVIVMDNASFHKRLDIQESIRRAGHTLLFLPP